MTEPFVFTNQRAVVEALQRNARSLSAWFRPKHPLDEIVLWAVGPNT
jgi:hypothetical protein